MYCKRCEKLTKATSPRLTDNDDVSLARQYGGVPLSVRCVECLGREILVYSPEQAREFRAIYRGIR